MLGYVVAKSRELSTRLEAPAGAAGAASGGDGAVDAHDVEAAASGEGGAFLRQRQARMDRVLARHRALVASGEELGAELAKTRQKLLDQAESAQFLAQNFHLVARVRQQLGHLRGLVEKIAEDAEDVENLLAQRSEEYMAKQNAEFAARQQEELERFEQQILHEKEGRKRALLEERRQRLAQAFHDDLKTYQTLVSYQGGTAASAQAESDAARSTGKETLDSIDLVVEADAEQLDAFYDSDSTSETELTPRFKPSEPANTQGGDGNDDDDVDPNAIPDAVPEEEEKQEEKISTAVVEGAGTPSSGGDQASEADANTSVADDKDVEV